MSIAAIEAIPIRLERRRPVRFANGEVSTAEHVLVRVVADDGAVGVAEASPRPMTYGDTPGAVVDALRTLIVPAVIGADERNIEAVHGRLRHVVHNVTARAALDVALWDLKARRAQLPLAELLGGSTRRVQVAHLLGLDTPRAMAEEAEAVARGFGVRAFKVKVGQSFREDVERAAAVRSAVGDEATLYLDANHGWTAEEALAVMRALERAQIEIAWLEEPTPATETAARRWLVERLNLPVVADESATDLASAASELTSGRAHWVSLKTGRTGFTFSRQIADLSLGLGASVVVGSQIEGGLGALANLHLAAAFGACHRYPAEVTSGHGYTDDVVPPLPIEDGWITVPDRPGLGLDIQEERLQALRMDR
ncbi:MAG: mandelate racemase/muconate lactonizing enzyme family protein [Myxococcota bacterium]